MAWAQCAGSATFAPHDLFALGGIHHHDHQQAIGPQCGSSLGRCGVHGGTQGGSIGTALGIEVAHVHVPALLQQASRHAKTHVANAHEGNC